MCSIASPSTDGSPPNAGFDPDMQGRQAQCDGGGSIKGTNFAGRQEFSGTLTGVYRDFGDFDPAYPWRWYLMSDLTRKPTGFTYEAVWCAADSLTLIGSDKLAGT